MDESLKEKSESLKSHFGLQFSEWNGTVVGFTDVQKIGLNILKNNSSKYTSFCATSKCGYLTLRGLTKPKNSNLKKNTS